MDEAIPLSLGRSGLVVSNRRALSHSFVRSASPCRTGTCRTGIRRTRTACQQRAGTFRRLWRNLKGGCSLVFFRLVLPRNPALGLGETRRSGGWNSTIFTHAMACNEGGFRHPPPLLVSASSKPSSSPLTSTELTSACVGWASGRLLDVSRC